ncbi:MAG: hypothetical protein WDM78_22610 [Puia sp.]
MKKCWLIFYFMPVVFAQAQVLRTGSVVSGPMLGQVELRTASIWLQVSSDITSIALTYWKQGHPETSRNKIYAGELGKEFILFVLISVGWISTVFTNTSFILNQEKSPAVGSFHTKDLWQWRNPAPDSVLLPEAAPILMNRYMIVRVNPMVAIRLFLSPWQKIPQLSPSGWEITGIPAK